MDSIWTQTAQLPEFPALDRDLKTNVLIIGGGMTGVLCAYWLSRAGADCTLVEAKRIGCGATKNTTAKITVQHGFIYDKLIREFGAEKARLYLEANQAALDAYRSLCRKIDCDFEERDAYLYALSDRRKLEREQAALSRLGVPSDLVPDIPLPLSVTGALRLHGQAQFHPLKFLAAVTDGLRIFEHTKVLELAPGKASTPGGMISAKTIIIATHFPVLNKHGGYFLKLYQGRSYVLALKNAPRIDGIYRDENESGLSFRSYQDLLLLGGGGHRTGKPGNGWADLEAFARKHWPNAREITRWAAQDCMSLDGVPYIGLYAKHTPGLYTATGFNKWGMTSSMAAAMLLRDLILGRENPYASLFAPARSSLRRQLAVNGLESAIGLLTPAAPRCPHMGCVLKYNAAEQSWDCPCHGSRFAEDGSLIDNPATDDKQHL